MNTEATAATLVNISPEKSPGQPTARSEGYVLASTTKTSLSAIRDSPEKGVSCDAEDPS